MTGHLLCDPVLNPKYITLVSACMRVEVLRSHLPMYATHNSQTIHPKSDNRMPQKGEEQSIQIDHDFSFWNMRHKQYCEGRNERWSEHCEVASPGTHIIYIKN